jgi:hypothetical protein
LEVEVSVVGNGDGCHDGQAKADSVVRSGTLRSEAPKRLDQGADVVLVEEWATAFDDEPGERAVRLGHDLNPAPRLVMEDGVLDEVANHLRQECFAPPDRRRAQHALDGQSHGADRLAPLGERSGNHMVELEFDCDVVIQRRVLSAGKQEKALKEPIGLVETTPDLGGKSVDVGSWWSGLPGRHVERGADHRKRGPQFVGGVGHKAASSRGP